MKREKVIYLGLILLIAYLVLIDKNLFNTSENQTKTFNLSELKLTKIDVPCEVYLTKGENKKMVIEAPGNILNKISSQTNNGILTVTASLEKKIFGLFNVKNQLTEKVKIFINHDQLDRIIVSEQAKIISVDYKPISFHAANEVEKENSMMVKFSIPKIKISELGLIDIAPIILSHINIKTF